MPTKLLNATIGKSETQSSNMLSYKFTKDNCFNPDVIDREGDEYQMQLKSLQDTMKSIREMEEEDRDKIAAKGWAYDAI